MYALLCQFLRAEDGGSAAEYGLVACLIGIVIISAVVLVGGVVGEFYNYIGAEVSQALSAKSVLR